MEEYSYAENFRNVANVARIGNADDVRISYSVFVGDLDTKNNKIFIGGEADDFATWSDKNFLGGEFYSADDFTTWSDAAKAKQLVDVTLRLVDKNLADVLKLADVRDEIIAAIADIKNNDAATAFEIVRVVNKIFDYYISHGA